MSGPDIANLVVILVSAVALMGGAPKGYVRAALVMVLVSKIPETGSPLNLGLGLVAMVLGIAGTIEMLRRREA